MPRRTPVPATRDPPSSSNSSSSSSVSTAIAVSASSSSASGGNDVAANETNKTECIICFEALVQCAKIDGCIHKFCFECILNWSKVTNKCPICNQVFRKITEVVSEEGDISSSAIAAVASGSGRGRKRTAAGALNPSAKKPRVAHVQDREQYVSYSHTGTFGNGDSDDEDEDESYYSDMFGIDRSDVSFFSESESESGSFPVFSLYGMMNPQATDQMQAAMVLQSIISGQLLLNAAGASSSMYNGSGTGGGGQVIDLTLESDDESSDSSFTSSDISDTFSIDQNDSMSNDESSFRSSSSSFSSSGSGGSMHLEEDDSDDEADYQTMVRSGLVGTARGRGSSAPRRTTAARRPSSRLPAPQTRRSRPSVPAAAWGGSQTRARTRQQTTRSSMRIGGRSRGGTQASSSRRGRWGRR